MPTLKVLWFSAQPMTREQADDLERDIADDEGITDQIDLDVTQVEVQWFPWGQDALHQILSHVDAHQPYVVSGDIPPNALACLTSFMCAGRAAKALGYEDIHWKVPVEAHGKHSHFEVVKPMDAFEVREVEIQAHHRRRRAEG